MTDIERPPLGRPGDTIKDRVSRASVRSQQHGVFQEDGLYHRPRDRGQETEEAPLWFVAVVFGAGVLLLGWWFG